MAIPKVPEDAKWLIRDHEKILQSLQEGKNQLEAYENAASAAADVMIAQEVLRILKEIPVEELNRDKRGIRVKTLRDHGYQTVADVHFASWAELEAINGISDTGASEIKKFTQELTEQARQGVRIRLSTDNKSDEATRLVLVLSQWIRCHETAENCARLLDSQEQSVRGAIRDLAPSKNILRWLITSKDNKLKAQGAYQYLAGIMTQGYGPEAKETIENKPFKIPPWRMPGQTLKRTPLYSTMRWKASVTESWGQKMEPAACRRAWQTACRRNRFTRTACCAS